MERAPFDPSLIHVLIAQGLSLLVGLYPYFRRPTRLSRLFALATVSMALAALSELLVHLNCTHALHVVLNRAGYIFVVGVIWFYTQFWLEVAQASPQENPRTYGFIKTCALLTLALVFTPWLIAD